jgi:hypothetical protein
MSLFRVAMIIRHGILVCLAHRFWDVGRRLPDQFQVADRGIVVEPVGDQAGLIQTLGIGYDVLAEVDHVIDVETPYPLRHERPLVPRRAAALSAAPCR